MDAPMDEVIAVEEPDFPPEPPPPPPRSFPLVAWGFIILMAGYVVWHHSVPSEKQSAESGEDSGLLVMQMQGRLIVGLSNLLPSPSNQTQIETLNTGTVGRRLRAIILEGELAGPKQAEKLLTELDQKIKTKQIKLSDKDKQLKDILTRLYADYAKERFAAPSLKVSERDYLQKNLGWFGELALAPEKGSREVRDRSWRPPSARPSLC
jgi:hypothetical protein